MIILSKLDIENSLSEKICQNLNQFKFSKTQKQFIEKLINGEFKIRYRLLDHYNLEKDCIAWELEFDFIVKYKTIEDLIGKYFKTLKKGYFTFSKSYENISGGRIDIDSPDLDLFSENIVNYLIKEFYYFRDSVSNLAHVKLLYPQPKEFINSNSFGIRNAVNLTIIYSLTGDKNLSSLISLVLERMLFLKTKGDPMIKEYWSDFLNFVDEIENINITSNLSLV